MFITQFLLIDNDVTICESWRVDCIIKYILIEFQIDSRKKHYKLQQL